MSLDNEKKTDLEPMKNSRPQWGRILAWFGLGILLILLFLGLLKAQKGQMKVGEKAPRFSLTTFDGELIQPEDMQGKVVLLNLWASWCKPCEQEAADLETAWRYYKSRWGCTFSGRSLDRHG